MRYMQARVFQEEGFQPSALSWCWEMAENAKLSLYIIGKIQHNQSEDNNGKGYYTLGIVTCIVRTHH